jgi:hypothetical protein
MDGTADFRRPSPGVSPPDVSPDVETTYTSRLLDAKRKAQQRRNKPDRSSSDE